MPAPIGDLIVIGGPTASGKSRIAAAMARTLGTEVVNADARQFYHALRIGAALPTEAERQEVRHHFIGHLEVTEVMSAGAFERAAVPVIEDLLQRNGRAVLTGGSGLYIDAVLKGFDPLPTANHAIRHALQERFRREGLAPLLEDLKQRDPATWQRIDRHNPHRVIRALEICRAGGRAASVQRTGAIRIVLDVPRPELYARIDARVDRMMADGLLEEARALLPHRGENALRTVGYSELFAHFDGTCTLEEAVALIKQHTRNFAKRQMTWLRRDDGDHERVAPDEQAVRQAIERSLTASPDRAIR
jgi:tRNA dimethylallyltransferase